MAVLLLLSLEAMDMGSSFVWKQNLTTTGYKNQLRLHTPDSNVGWANVDSTHVGSTLSQRMLLSGTWVPCTCTQAGMEPDWNQNKADRYMIMVLYVQF